MNEKGVTRIKKEKSRLPVDVRVLKLPNDVYEMRRHISTVFVKNSMFDVNSPPASNRRYRYPKPNVQSYYQVPTQSDQSRNVTSKPTAWTSSNEGDNFVRPRLHEEPDEDDTQQNEM